MKDFKAFTEQEVVELLKKFDRQYTSNVNSDKWYFNWISQNKEKPNINLALEKEQYDIEVFKIR